MFLFLFFFVFPATSQVSGKKVDAQFVKDAYNNFLGNDGTPLAMKPKKAQTKEEKRAECRRKGIFVAADDKELEATIFEQPSTGSRPARIKDATRPLRWKKPGSKVPKRYKTISGITKKVNKKKDPAGISVSSKSEKTPEKVETEEMSKEVEVIQRLPPTIREEVLSVEPVEEKLSSPLPPESTTSPVSPCSSTSEQGFYTLREPLHTPKVPKEKEHDFGKFDDEEFEKLLEKEQAKCAEADKHAVAAARKILKAACREKAFENVLTKEENETLIRFFSGKIPYDEKVLKILDRALDKTIDWMETKNVKLSNETRELIEQRAALKKALFAEFLINPQYMPKTWAKKYEELRIQSKMEIEGVNWARLLLCYPTQKCFEDGPVDQYGNFTRGKRHWLLAAMMGPSDSKTFAETQREELCRGMYFDAAIMEKAKKEGDNTLPVIPKDQ